MSVLKILISMGILFGDFILDGAIARADESDNRIIINDQVYKHVPVLADFIYVWGRAGDDQINITPPEDGFFQYYGGPAKQFKVEGGRGDDTLIINASDNRAFKGAFVGGKDTDLVDLALPKDLSGWLIDTTYSSRYRTEMLRLRSSRSQIDLSLDLEVEAIGSGSTWFSVEDLYSGFIIPLQLRDILKSQSIKPNNSGGSVSTEVDTSTNKTIIRSVSGKGKLKGSKGADEFLFDTFDSFTKRKADKIIGFNSSDGDSLSFTSRAIPQLSRISSGSLAIAETKESLQQLSKEGYDFVYYEPKGFLYFDGNVEELGWGGSGEGGLVAILKGKPSLTAEDLAISL